MVPPPVADGWPVPGPVWLNSLPPSVGHVSERHNFSWHSGEMIAFSHKEGRGVRTVLRIDSLTVVFAVGEPDSWVLIHLTFKDSSSPRSGWRW